MIDAFFVLATAAFGWGLSLATYRLFALRNRWPMGQLHADLPIIPILVGVGSLAIGLIAAAARGTEFYGWLIVLIGALLAVFWTGFLRVGSQVSLFLAPAAAALLVLGVMGAPIPGNYELVPVGYNVGRQRVIIRDSTASGRFDDRVYVPRDTR